jgi:hypothetical protein
LAVARCGRDLRQLAAEGDGLLEKKKVNFSAPHATILGDEASASATKRVPVKERITHGSLKKKSDRRAGFVL